MPGHRVYPNPFAELYIGTLDTVKGTDLIWDTMDTPEPPEDGKNPSKTGVAYKPHLEVSSFTCVRFDAHNGAYERKRDACFAPFSHDGDANFGEGDGGIPEPTSVAWASCPRNRGRDAPDPAAKMAALRSRAVALAEVAL